MEKKFIWNSRKCLEWETEKPSEGRPRQSPVFYFQNRLCYLKLSVTLNYNSRQYILGIKSNGGYNSFQACNVIVHVKRRPGHALLPQTSTEECWKNSDKNIWNYYDYLIESEIPGFGFNSSGVLRFCVFFDNLGKDMTGKGEEKSLQTPSYLNPYPCLEELSGDLSNLLVDEGNHYDVKLKCGDLTVNAHKNILSARSEVFKKMLQSDMMEARTGVVDINDMDPGDLVTFLRYLYTGKLPALTMDAAMRLFEAGDKYDVKGLVARCTSFLSDENITEKNACELLVLADAHNRQDFKQKVIVYILDKKMPLQGGPWRSFCDKHPNLAVEVLNRFVSSNLAGQCSACKRIKLI